MVQCDCCVLYVAVCLNVYTLYTKHTEIPETTEKFGYGLAQQNKVPYPQH